MTRSRSPPSCRPSFPSRGRKSGLKRGARLAFGHSARRLRLGEPTTPVMREEVLEDLDVAGHLLSLPFHELIWLFARRQGEAVGDPEILADQHVAAVLLPPHGVISPPHL